MEDVLEVYHRPYEDNEVLGSPGVPGRNQQTVGEGNATAASACSSIAWVYSGTGMRSTTRDSSSPADVNRIPNIERLVVVESLSIDDAIVNVWP